jgi:hypothetical protein
VSAAGGAPPKEEDVARGRTQRAGTVGVTEHGSSAVLVIVAPGWCDRERVFRVANSPSPTALSRAAARDY